MPFFFDYRLIRLYPYPLLFTCRTGYDVYNNVVRWHPAGPKEARGKKVSLEVVCLFLSHHLEFSREILHTYYIPVKLLIEAPGFN